MLIDASADVAARDEINRTALIFSASDAVTTVLIARGADVNAADDDGNTPLMVAANDGAAALESIRALRPQETTSFFFPGFEMY